MPNNLTLRGRFFARGTRADGLPSYGGADLPAGHVFVDDITGEHFTNIGDENYSMHTDGWTNRFVLTERFLQRPALKAALDTFSAQVTQAEMLAYSVANKNFSLLGTNADAADCTFADGGGIVIETDGAENDSQIIMPSLSTNQTAWSAAKWNTNDEISFECVILTPAAAAIVASTIYAGFKLTNTEVTATDNDQCFFRYNDATSEGKWTCIDSNNGTDNVQETAITVGAAISYALRIQVDGNRIPRYYINGSLVATGNALKADADLIPYIGVKNVGAGGAKKITIRGLRCGKTYND